MFLHTHTHICPLTELQSKLAKKEKNKEHTGTFNTANMTCTKYQENKAELSPCLRTKTSQQEWS